MQSPKLLLTPLAILLLALPGASQQPSPKPLVDDAFVQKEFGSTCTVMAGPQPLKGDLNGDGVEDLVVVGHCTNPLLDEAENNYKLIDPYNTYFGYGDTRITTKFSSEDPLTRGLVLLIVHGVGTETWHSPAPKVKYVIINLPFKEVMLRKLALKKKNVTGIYAQEASGDKMLSVVFWDGKKYRYMPLGAGME